MVQASDVMDAMDGWIRNRSYGHYVVFNTANDMVESATHTDVRNAMNQSDLCVPDGISLVLLGRMHGYTLRRRVYGPDLMLDFLKRPSTKSYRHFFYGGTAYVLTRLVEYLRNAFPNIQIAGYHAPPFRPLSDEEDKEIMDKINQAHPDVVWVGLGGPKQQLWMHAHRACLRVPVMAGVGAAFDFLSGAKPQAPIWLRNNGLEWLFRLFTEPRRLWRRYLVNNARFLVYMGREGVRLGGRYVHATLFQRGQKTGRSYPRLTDHDGV